MSLALLFYYFLLISLLLFLFLFIGYVFYKIIVGYKRKKVGDYAPFVVLPGAVVGEVVKALDLQGDSVFYDLGCGDGRVIKAGSMACPSALCVGLERDWLPYVMAKLNTRNITKDRLQILKKDIFDQDLSNATHLFTYLFPDLLDNLLPKLERELQSGAKLVSVDFKFSKKEPMEVIKLDRSSWKLGRKIYVYRF